ncbi:TetR/AcrR family transcriptional regulator C-terminal domain-containing protein [Streptomyces aureoverticillatus]|uniref:TetR/AcrR family transcriptional regulator C-terminal domain-containing protein n=1 Tax=Streptomyces aureoverticillatus TaxID=66871 RepID=UPI0013DC471C|nr:TetR/AcrR family transcriptional regulator C-terminal domain-containing protein [Streptomyces aureoverticillatus]QIB45751.1 hypothetical protein G3H79_24435 [Streptomyces aureoverticillatus]
MPASGTHLIYGPETARRQDHCYRVFEAAGFTGEELDGAVTTLLTFVTGTALEDAAAATLRARIRREGGDEEQGVKEVVEWANGIAREFPRLRARIEAGTQARVAETPGSQGADAQTAPEPDAAPETAPSTAKIAFGVEIILDGLQARLGTRTGGDAPRR